jgi:cyclophilin family peptidyl-prolyl cis-trans isomerase
MPPADKRARKKENARAAREQREAAARRKKRTRSMITVGVVVALFVGVIILLNATGGDDETASTTPTAATTPTVYAPDAALDPSKTYTATITTNFGDIKIALDVKNAPKGAAHFVRLARSGFYNGSRWHRVVKTFVVQGGAPGGDPSQAYGHSIVGEIPKVTYKVGDVLAAKTETDPKGTFDAQFFILMGPAGQLTLDYADFGHVTSGMDALRRMTNLEVDGRHDPGVGKATIDKVTISEA